ncbi:MAG: glycosyltransferase family 1 protein [Planctomycetes bacterium]|nr:glycosyltransferase family 1 protein [Planctomycetota bacterium]
MSATTELAAPVAAADPRYRAIVETAQRFNAESSPAALAELVRAHVALGLRGPARELVLAAAPLALREPLLAATSGPSGRVSWGRFADRFERNLALLGGRGVDTAELREAWQRERQRFELYEDALGCKQVRVCGADGAWRWAQGLADHALEAANAAPPADHRASMPGPYAFDGVGIGWLLARIWERSRNTFLGYSAALYVVEPDAAALAVALHLHDWTALLSDTSVLWFLGESAAQRLAEHLLADPNLPSPRIVFNLPVDPSQPAERNRRFRSELEGCIRTRGQREQAGRTELEARFQPLDTRHWAERFCSAWVEKKRPLRVLAAISTHTTFLQYSMNDALHALERLGCRTRLLTDPRPHETIGVATYHAAVREFDPDLFLAIDHLRPGFQGRIPSTLPLLTWDQDNLPTAFTDEQVRGIGPHDVVVGLPHTLNIAAGCASWRKFRASQMPVNPLRFSSGDLAPEDLAAYRCDVSYVSHASQTPAEFHTEERDKIADPNGRTLLDRLCALCVQHTDAFGSVDGRCVRELLRRAERETGVNVADPAMRERLESWYIWRLCDRRLRHQTLEWVAAWARRTGRSLRIYGRGWERHPSLHAFAAGPIANDGELLKVYKASAINLQIMPAGFLHQRALDGLAAGAFFLARRTLADRRDPRLPVVWKRVEDVGLHSAADVLACDDVALKRDFLAVGVSLGYDESRAAATYEFLRFDRQWDYAEEVFADFAGIAFSTAAEFELLADRYLQSSEMRSTIAQRMQETTRQRYSYEVKMRQFMDFFAAYLADSASAIERGENPG